MYEACDRPACHYRYQKGRAMTTWTSDELDKIGNADEPRLDAAYRATYRRYSGTYVDPMVTPEARATTIKLVPRATDSG
jgi:Uncharacterized protein conserved in bacteria (DUF2255)